MIKANLIHLSYNMWCDCPNPIFAERGLPDSVYSASLRFDETLWKSLVVEMAKAGLNMVVLDVGDGVQFKTHPEISVRGAWSPAKLKEELARCRARGLEPIPKLNFSTAHDAWLGEYSRMVSTPMYYKVCRDLIRETMALFDGPRFFHLGMDEEMADHQNNYIYAVMRQGALWWDDLRFLVKCVEDCGARGWIWSDKLWHCGKAEFGANMPKAVIQSNWYYDRDFRPAQMNASRVGQAFQELEALGYTQIPTGSNWSWSNNLPMLVGYCREQLSAKRLLGFCQTPWLPTLGKYRYQHLDAIEMMRQAFVAPTRSRKERAKKGMKSCETDRIILTRRC